MLAVLVVLGRFVQGQPDAFWVAAQTSIPFVVPGICLGMHARSTDEAQPAAEPAATLPATLPVATPDGRAG